MIASARRSAISRRHVTATAPTLPVEPTETEAFGGTTAAVPALPTGITTGDMLLLVLYAESTAFPAITPPSGWTQQGGVAHYGTEGMLAVYTRKYEGSSVAGTFTFGSAISYYEIQMMRVSGASAVNAVNGAVANVSGTSFVLPSVTTTEANTLLLAVMSNYIGAEMSVPSGWTNYLPKHGVRVLDKVQAAAGASPSPTITIGSAASGVIVLAIAGGGSTGGGGGEEGGGEPSVGVGYSTNSDEESAPSAAAYALGPVGYARGEHGVGTAASSVATQASYFHAKGISYVALATFTGTLPTAAQAKGLKAWAEALASLGVKYIEFGNETSYGYQYGEVEGEWYNSSSYKKRAKEYAERAKEAAEALVGTGVKLLVQGDDGGSGAKTWVNEVFAAWPGIASHAAFGGWTVHAYPKQNVYESGGKIEKDPSGLGKMERLVKSTEEHGDSTSGIFDTEWGVPSTSLGTTMASGQSMTWAEGALVLEAHKPELETKAKGRLKMLLLYQNHDQASELDSEGKPRTEREWFFGALTSVGGRKGAFTTMVEGFLKGTF